MCVWVGAFGWGALTGDCGRKVSTQRKHACIFAGSDVRGKCKRITLTLSSCMYCRSRYHGRRKREQAATAPPLSGEWGGSPPPPTLDIL